MTGEDVYNIDADGEGSLYAREHGIVYYRFQDDEKLPVPIE